MKPKYYNVVEMDGFNWDQDKTTRHLRTFIREGEIGNTAMSTPVNMGFSLRKPYGKNERFKFRHLGMMCQFNASGNGLIHVEPQCYLGEFCTLYAVGSEIWIGEGLMMAPFSSIFASGHDPEDLDKTKNGKVKIGDNVWIGEGAQIMQGVTIADNCVIGSNAVVTHSVEEPYTLVGGVPAKKIRSLK